MAKTISGQLTVSSAGTAEQGPSAPEGSVFLVKALPGNSGNVFVGNDGSDDVASGNGYVLAPGDEVELHFFGEASNALSACWFDVGTGGDGVCWLKVRD
jgi:protein involved in polysaccharide export with SLBB domain